MPIIVRLLTVSACIIMMEQPLLSVPSDESHPTSKSHALLVGCTRYASLEPKKQLNGPENDVQLFRSLLVEKFHFRDDDIVTLAEYLNEATVRPTRANIVREFERLVSIVQPGDHVVILLAGHGSQQPDNDAEGGDDDEPDGFDESFLPADIGAWDSSRAVVANAIVDDEIRGWLTSMQSAGAFVFFVADSCHSGTLTRGNGSEVTRHIDPDVLIPKIELERARRTGEKRTTQIAEKRRGDGADLPKDGRGIVAFYAAQPDEEEPEMPLPRHEDQQKWYGLLSHTIAEVLQQSKSPLTYRELSHQVHQRYIQIGRLSWPTPMMEGTNLEREILGQKDWPERPQYAVTRNAAGALTLNAGLIHGWTKGSILEVFPPAGAANAEQSLGHVRIDKVRSLECMVVPCEYADSPKPENVEDGSRVRIVYQDFGELRLHVAVDGYDIDENPLAKERSELLAKILADLSDADGSLVLFEPDVAKADWLVRSGADDVFLVPASGHSSPARQPNAPDVSAQSQVPSPRYGPGKIDNHLTYWLASQFQRIARVSNLKRMVNTGGADGTTGEAVNIAVEIEHVEGDEADREDTTIDTGITAVHEKDIVRFRVHNRGTVQVDVTLLYIDSDFGITALLPRERTTDTNRIDPGKSLASEKHEITAASDLEHIIAIAVLTEPQKPRMEFTCLAQEGLPRSRGGTDSLDSPLGQLLKNAMYAEGQTRGAPAAVLNRYAVTSVTLRVDPPRSEE